MKSGRPKVAGCLAMDIISAHNMIRVVNAFRHGVDGTQMQQAASNQNVQRVLARQASLNKRLSTCSSISEEPVTANNSNKSGSHTETAV